MPTMREVALRIGLSHTAVEKRVAKIERLVSAYFR